MAVPETLVFIPITAVITAVTAIGLLPRYTRYRVPLYFAVVVSVLLPSETNRHVYGLISQ